MDESQTTPKVIDYIILALKYTILSTLIVLLIRGFLFVPIAVEGNSMKPTLKQNDMLIVDRVSNINQFDVVVFRQNDGSMYVKRVIGLPGDKIAYNDNELYVNDQKIPETFLNRNNYQKNNYTNDFTLDELLGVERLGKDSYFVMGDNRRMSKDSRSFGAISGDSIIGKGRFVYYPFKDTKAF